MRLPKRWKYKNTSLLLASFLALFLLADTEIAHTLIRHVGTYGYVGALVTGVFFVSTFTVAPASVVLFHLAQEFNPLIVALFAGAGAVVGDLLIFRFLKDGVFDEMRPLVQKLGGSYLSALFRTPYFAWLIPVAGALIIASPFPDEIGVGLLGLSKMAWWQFVILAFVLNAAGIFLIVSLATAL
jgi:uncharacterized membrane protein YdjX (TVP38/TMEM64 family)